MRCFKWNTTGLNWEFSFSWTVFHITIKNPNMSYYLSTRFRRILGLILFPKYISVKWNTNSCVRHTAVPALWGLISSVYRGLPHWISNQQPQNAKPQRTQAMPKLTSRKQPSCGSICCTQCLPDFLVMVIQFITPLLKKRCITLSRIWTPVPVSICNDDNRCAICAFRTAR